MTFRTLEARNVHQVFPVALDLIYKYGALRDSRNGQVLQYSSPVTTTYLKPAERVLFWPDRDANPFFHLYECLWMLSGRNDLRSLLPFVSRFSEFSDDGETLAGAYGHRWISHFGSNQLLTIASRLFSNDNDRRCVLTMWDPRVDLGSSSADVPCNLVVSFQRDAQGSLDMTVFCRSNDIIWGAYGANAVHFSMLQEYLAVLIGCPIGVYHQISVNWHAYLSEFLKVKHLRLSATHNDYCPYSSGEVVPMQMTEADVPCIPRLLEDYESGFKLTRKYPRWSRMVQEMLFAHWLFKNKAAPEKYLESMEVLGKSDDIDWHRAGKEWISRRYANWERKMKA